MKSVYESIMAGLTEAVEDAKSSKKRLKRRFFTKIVCKLYGVSYKTVEAWEAGINHPSVPQAGF